MQSLLERLAQLSNELPIVRLFRLEIPSDHSCLIYMSVCTGSAKPTESEFQALAGALSIQPVSLVSSRPVAFSHTIPRLQPSGGSSHVA
jgi:hypothetical protein